MSTCDVSQELFLGAFPLRGGWLDGIAVAIATCKSCTWTGAPRAVILSNLRNLLCRAIYLLQSGKYTRQGLSRGRL